MLQGTVFNAKLLEDFQEREESYFRTIRERGVRFTDGGTTPDGNELLRLDDDTRIAIVELARKVSLALYYRITGGACVTKEQRIALTFYTADRIHLVADNLRAWSEPPLEASLAAPELAAQFTYSYLDLRRINSSLQEGWRYSVAFHFHQGYLCFATYLDDEQAVKPEYKIVTQPYSHSQ